MSLFRHVGRLAQRHTMLPPQGLDVVEYFIVHDKQEDEHHQVVGTEYNTV